MGAGVKVGDEDKEGIGSHIPKDFAYIVGNRDLTLKAKDHSLRKQQTAFGL